jgi:hypothetical protein
MLSKEALAVFGRAAVAIAGIEGERTSEISRADKNRLILGELRQALKDTGTLCIVGGVPVHVMPDGHMTEILPKSRELDEILIACGIMPESNVLDKAIYRFLLADDYPEKEINVMSKYLPQEHALLVNLCDGRYLRFDHEGVPTVHINGEGGYLFERGTVPHVADLETISAYKGGALAWDENSPLIRHVFGVGVYGSESGVGRQVALDVQLAWLLAGMFPERVKAQPLLHLHGLSGTRKTSMATALGWVISPKGHDFHAVAAPDDRTQMEVTLINSKGLLCLDEANNLRTLFSLLKAIITSAVVERRILYTTAGVQRFIVRLLCILTTNNLELFDEAVARRVLKIDMGDPRGEEVSYRGDGSVEREWRENNLAAACWTDLMCRVSATMRLLSAARAKGADDPAVRYRMSGFWSFVMAVAAQEDPEILDRMTKAAEAIHSEQSRSVNTADDLLPVLHDWLSTHKEEQGVELSASEIGSALMARPDIGSGLYKILGSSMLLSNKLTASSEYIRLLGMRVLNGKRTKKFVFDLSKVESE